MGKAGAQLPGLSTTIPEDAPIVLDGVLKLSNLTSAPAQSTVLPLYAATQFRAVTQFNLQMNTNDTNAYKYNETYRNAIQCSYQSVVISSQGRTPANLLGQLCQVGTVSLCDGSATTL